MIPIVLSKTGAGSSTIAPLDMHGRPEISLQIVVTGTVNYTVQQTLDNPFGTATLNWFDHPDVNLVSQTVNRQGNYAYVPRAVKLLVNSGSGTAVLTILQSGIKG